MIKGLFAGRERGFLKTGRMSMDVSTESGVGGVGSGLLIFAVSAGHYLRLLVKQNHRNSSHLCPLTHKEKDEITYRFFAI